MVATTLFVCVSIAETLSLPALATYAVAPSGAMAMASGAVPTGIVATTLSVAVSMADAVKSLHPAHSFTV